MEPRVIGRFGATGDDGNRYTVEVVRDSHRVAGGGRAEDSLADFRTADGREVARAGEGEDGYFWVVGTGARLTPDIPFKEIMEMISRDWRGR